MIIEPALAQYQAIDAILKTMADPTPTDHDDANEREFWKRALWILEVVTPGTRGGSSRFHALGRPTLVGRKLAEHGAYMASSAATREQVTVFVADRTTMANALIWWIAKPNVLPKDAPAGLPETALVHIRSALLKEFDSLPGIHERLIWLARERAIDRDPLLTDRQIRDEAVRRIQNGLG